ncbi:uncharacterized protein B0I36DRAFT_415604 [Microdochium trichocladiopsis]|uniref:Zn(II)2Cys6 transcription factor n=1 Tax=Microdochium trichocladiopsis TaxID=1682393 RepID=A0A9P9BKY1_9PEZI|nr:uncharacterized protein B0I36DRAFT_415604 [Microdochium trichocladiopsis]KAH7024372.1 hypothetical protein B0I36DRAFT_415604 [Microdochium trichocladiopsis]
MFRLHRASFSSELPRSATSPEPSTENVPLHIPSFSRQNTSSTPQPLNSPHESEEEDREVSFFLRHFSEAAGRWMDLFDLDCYYSRQVPVLARSNPLVKYAACALAAKQLGRVNGRKAVFGGLSHRLASMETWPRSDTSASDYMWYGMKYYDKSISLLMQAISDEDGNTGGARRDDYNRRYDDETIVAATILCIYEFLSATTTGWSRHLDGTQSLLRLTNQELLFQFQPSPRPAAAAPTPPKALRAAFWNFARQDFLASIISCKHTRLNINDLEMWRAMGLSLDEMGLVSMLDADPPLRDDMVANTLVWLLCKIGNFIASDEEQEQAEGDCAAAAGGLGSRSLHDTWRMLDVELTRWHDSLPDTFQPSTQVRVARLSPSLDTETWYSNSMCASTMQSYHMARMLMLLHRPPELLLLLDASNDTASSGSHPRAPRRHRQDLLSTYKTMQTQLFGHAVHICSIALGRPDDSTRIHMLQPLYYSGRCMSDRRDQKVVRELIEDIERDTGWATGYRVEQLVQEWAV